MIGQRRDLLILAASATSTATGASRPRRRQRLLLVVGQSRDLPRLRGKLPEMGRAVHRRRGLWIAPAAPGFDARLIGGTTVVPRRKGATLRRELDAATRSSPDAIGLISWNEFSENTTSSRACGTARSLEVLADLLDAKLPPMAGDLDSSEPAGTGRNVMRGVATVAGFLVLTLGGFLVVARRRRRRRDRG